MRDQGARRVHPGHASRRSDDDERAARRRRPGLDCDHVYEADELVRGDNTFFVATGVTDGELVDGVRKKGPIIRTESDRAARPLGHDPPRASPTTSSRSGSTKPTDDLISRADVGGAGHNEPMTDASRLPRALRPFSSGQYRLLVAALSASLLSAGAWLVAAVWQVVELGGSPIDLSYVAVGASLGLVVAVLVRRRGRRPHSAALHPDRRRTRARGRRSRVAAVLAASGVIEVWHLAVLSFVLGVADGFFYPAYSAWLPAILPSEQLLAANGVEGVLRPAVMQAAGPALASALIAVQAPWLAFAVVAVLQGAPRRCSW